MICLNNDGSSQEIMTEVMYEGHQCYKFLPDHAAFPLSRSQDITGEGDHPLLPILHLKELHPNGEVGSVAIQHKDILAIGVQEHKC